MNDVNRSYTKEEELWIERSWGKVSISRIAKKLNRSEDSVRIKAWKMGLGSMLDNRDYLIISDIISILGIERRTLKRYIDKYSFPGKKKLLSKNNKVLAVEYEDFINWLEDNDIWDSTKVDTLSLILLGYDSIKLEEKVQRDTKKLESKTLSDKDVEKIIKYHKQCYKYREIADLTGKDYHTVTWKIHKLIKSGTLVKHDRKGKILRDVNRENYGWTVVQDNTLIELFREGKSLKEISEIVGKSLSATKNRNQLLSKRLIDGLSI